MYSAALIRKGLSLVIIGALVWIPAEALAQWSDATSGPLGDANNGSGVAWGDYDNDGDLDLYLVNSGQANRLFRNDGGGSFVDATSSPLGDTNNGAGVAWGDHDNDGDLDLYLANGVFQSNRLFQNHGDGIFADSTNGLPLGDLSTGRGVGWGDYDNDGDLDLYLVNGGQANKLLRNDSGTWVDATVSPLDDGGNGWGVAWGDYDNDGDLDLYLANSGQANKLFRNDGGGIFSDATAAPLDDTGNGRGVAWGDYDNDGDLDLYLANDAGVNRLFRNDAGTFADVTGGPLGDTGDGRSVAWGDYDNDGDLDLYLSNNATANKLLRNDGGGTFVDATVSPLDDANGGRGVAWGDYDNDGDLDLYLANGGQANKLFRNGLAASNHWLHVDLLGVASNTSAIGARVRVVAGGANQIREISGGSGYFSQNSLTAEFGLGTATTVDTLEIAWPSGLVQQFAPLMVSVDQSITVTEGEDVSWFDATSGPLEDTVGGLGVAWGDYDSDGDIDLYLTRFSSGNKLFRNDGGGTFVDATSGPLGDTGNGRGVAWGDYDNDGDLDLYLANDSGANKLFRNDGGGIFVDATSGPLGDMGCGHGVAWADHDNDGDLDLYLANFAEANKLFRNDGGGTFADATSGPLGDTGSGRGVAWGDYDNDGDLDLYLSNLAEANKLFRNDGGGTFADATSGPLGDTNSGRGVAWGDYDNDGDLDLYIASGNTPNRLFRNDGGGTFVDATSGPLGDPDDGSGVAWGDYDNDGDLDLYLTNAGEANKLFRNDGGGSFADATSGPLGDTGNGAGAAWGDYDNDGDLDLYLANVDEPSKLLRNDNISGNHWLHINLVGVASNTSAIGARVRIVAGAVSQIREISGGSGFYSQNSLAAEFGLGTATTVDLVEISWPSGAVDQLTGIAVDQAITVAEGVSATITSITDVPNDQGRQVRIEWQRGGLDRPGTSPVVTEYAIFREFDPNLAAPASSGKRPSQAAIDGAPPLVQFPPGWDFVKTVPAFAEELYSTNVPTLADSTISQGAYFSKFLVRAMTAAPAVFFDSAPDSGYSVDNLAPFVPQGFSVAHNTGSGNALTWDPSPEEDLQYYRIYRSTDPDFVPTPGDLVDATTVTSWSDPDFDDGTVHYKITAVDFSGNESNPASADTATSTQAPVVTERFALHQNVPNPFNPSTVVRYDVPAGGGFVSLRVYDVNGRLVRTLVEKTESVGKKHVLWNGTNHQGDGVSTGVYYYRLTSPGTQKTRKMLLVK